MDKPTGKYSTPIRMFLWVCVIAYMAALPHLIIVFKFFLGFIPLPIIKALPAISLVIGGLTYLGLCCFRKTGYGIVTFILPAFFLIAAVFWLESNPIKHIHIPLYAVLACLIFYALRRGDTLFPIIVASTCYAAILGVFDEIHHGLHPERYFGWKDMVINAAGAMIGGLFIANIHTIKPRRLFNLRAVDKVFWVQLAMIFLGALITILSVVTLFDVVQNGFKAAYPTSLFIANIVAIILCLAVAGFSLPKLKTRLEVELLLFFPVLILISIQMLICVGYVQNIAFH